LCFDGIKNLKYLLMTTKLGHFLKNLVDGPDQHCKIVFYAVTTTVCYLISNFNE